MRFTIFEKAGTQRKVGRKWVESKRRWAVSEDTRAPINKYGGTEHLVSDNMTEEDARLVARLLNAEMGQS